MNKLFSAMAQPAFLWQFIEYSDGPRPRWIWQRIAIDGTTTHRSEDFEKYGAAIHNAIGIGGFKPKTEGWSVITRSGATHFDPEHADKETSSQLAKVREKLESGPPCSG